jgi:hypothetical protein
VQFKIYSQKNHQIGTGNNMKFVKNSTIQADENSINLDGGRKITIFSFMAVFLSIKQLF